MAFISLWSGWQVIFLTYLQQLEPPLMDFYEAFSTPEPPQLMAAEVLQHSATLGKHPMGTQRQHQLIDLNVTPSYSTNPL